MGRTSFLLLAVCIALDAPSAVADPPPSYLFSWGTQGTGDGQFWNPTGVAVDDSGNVYVTEQNNDRVQKFTSNGAFVKTWGSYGNGNGQFTGPECIAVDRNGFVYVGDGGVPAGNKRIQKFTRDGTYVTQWGSSGTGNGQFNGPYGVAVDASGTFVYVADYGNHRIQKFTSVGVFVSAWGSHGTGDGQFEWPRRVAVDAAGDVYVADQNNHRIQKFTSTGVFLTKWGSYGNSNGDFNTPVGVITDRLSGDVFVADYNNHRLQKFTSTGVFLTTWGSAGSGAGQFNGPYGAALDQLGNIYVPDYNNHRIQKFSQVVVRAFTVRIPSGFIARTTASSGLHLVFSGTGGAATLAVVGNGPGCSIPVVSNPGSPWDITWSSECVDPGESITVTISSSSDPPLAFVSGYWTPGNIPLNPGDVVEVNPVPSLTWWGAIGLLLALAGLGSALVLRRLPPSIRVG